jgi:hypothetical protein
MKQKIKITGVNVHDLLYESFLLRLAFEAGIMRFGAKREIEDGKEVVILTMDEDERQIEYFGDLLDSERCEKVEILDIEHEAFDGDVPELILTMTAHNCKMVGAYCKNKDIR